MNSLPLQKTLDESELRTLVLQYRKQNWQGIQTPQWQERIVEDIVRDDGETVLRAIAEFWTAPQGASVLDIGSGVGSFVVACRRRGFHAFGIEPDRIGQGARISSIQIARRRLENQVFAVGVGERLPFADRSFDLITMNQVMEHVSEQSAMLREALRVLKHKGAIYIASPNYLRFYEPHYKIKWFPLLPKFLGRWYLRLRGRDPVLLEQLVYTTNARLRALFRGLGTEYVVVDLHREAFLRKCAQLSFASRRARLVGTMTRIPGLGPWILRAVLQFWRITEGGCEMMIIHQPETVAAAC
ncbi:MAG: class I SAM-dependent methyltransferase [Terriglobales bacterium]